jgi:hypothetical protein
MKQVWFSGAHSNVGGGYVDAGLSDIAFNWMIKMATLRGLEFDPVYLNDPERVHADYRGELIDSFSFVYRLLGPYLRPIGQTHENPEGKKAGVGEMMHQSVVDHHAANLFT